MKILRLKEIIKKWRLGTNIYLHIHVLRLIFVCGTSAMIHTSNDEFIKNYTDILKNFDRVEIFNFSLNNL